MYSLSAVLKLRTHKNNLAEHRLMDAIKHHEEALKKLKQIENSLENSLLTRAQLQDNFFVKSKLSGSNKRELLCHISSSQKTIMDENMLKKCLRDQEEAVRLAATKLTIAQSNAFFAKQNLKLIEKHYDSWQQEQHHAEKIKEEYNNDDLNCARFIINRHRL